MVVDESAQEAKDYDDGQTGQEERRWVQAKVKLTCNALRSTRWPTSVQRTCVAFCTQQWTRVSSCWHVLDSMLASLEMAAAGRRWSLAAPALRQHGRYHPHTVRVAWTELAMRS